MQGLAVKRLGRSCRRWQLYGFQMDLRGHWSSVCTALLCNRRRSQVAPSLERGIMPHLLYS
ncbi:hypothetical protein CARN8_1510005 [mine drainage metagenome]|uniref:Uncharacterized protein n=1 Tax=mine drainage metagenome TaxID=410659 RepID=A0A3P3ZLR5_9ZZZZ